VNDNFFEPGSHSLLAMRLVASFREGLQIELPLHAPFQAPTLSGMAVLAAATLRDYMCRNKVVLEIITNNSLTRMLLS